jgi:hypothetical protein
MSTLGDAVPGGGSDELYTGESSDSVLSMQYYRDKARQFQVIMNQLDASQVAAQSAIEADIDASLTDDLSRMLAEFDAKRFLIRTTAEAINLGAEAVNAMGGRFPQLSIPSGLGFLPILPFAAIAAIGTAAGLIVWGNTWITGVNDRLRLAQQFEAVADPDKRAALASSLAMSDSARLAAESSPLSSVASMIKWGALAFGAFLLWRAYSASNSGAGG